MLLIAGLGNPGPKYAHNRHNIGFMAADEIFRRHRFSNWQKKFQAEIADGVIDGEKVLLIKPQTFMNLSGQSVGEAMRFYKLTPADLVVIYDELDLNPGKLRIKTGGGSGGHNGIKSIDSHMQSFPGGQNYRRMRLGIGHPGAKELVHNYVLGDFAKADNEWLDTLLGAVSPWATAISVPTVSRPTPRSLKKPRPKQRQRRRAISARPGQTRKSRIFPKAARWPTCSSGFSGKRIDAVPSYDA